MKPDILLPFLDCSRISQRSLFPHKRCSVEGSQFFASPHSLIPPWSWFCQSVKARCQTLCKARADSPHPLCKNSNCNPTHRFILCPSPLPQSPSPLSFGLFFCVFLWNSPVSQLTCCKFCSSPVPLPFLLFHSFTPVPAAPTSRSFQPSYRMLCSYSLNLCWNSQTHARAHTRTVETAYSL